jgi:predicted HTH transcriptional regulator
MSDKMSDKNFYDVLLSYLRENGKITAAEASKVLNHSAQTARRALSELVADGMALATGANRNRKYRTWFPRAADCNIA